MTVSQTQQKNFDEFTANFQDDTIRKWQKMIEDWNANRKAPNPYVEPAPSKSFFVYPLLLCSFLGRYINCNSSS